MSAKQNPMHLCFFGCTGKVFRANYRRQFVKQTWRVLGFSYALYLCSLFFYRYAVKRPHSVEGLAGVMFG